MSPEPSIPDPAKMRAECRIFIEEILNSDRVVLADHTVAYSNFSASLYPRMIAAGYTDYETGVIQATAAVAALMEAIEDRSPALDTMCALVQSLLMVTNGPVGWRA